MTQLWWKAHQGAPCRSHQLEGFGSAFWVGLKGCKDKRVFEKMVFSTRGGVYPPIFLSSECDYEVRTGRQKKLLIPHDMPAGLPNPALQHLLSHLVHPPMAL